MRYKLIKEYPGSPELWTVVEKKYSSTSSYSYKHGDKNLCIHNNHVENNPEYWEEVNDNIWWIVWEKKENRFDLYKPYRVETSLFNALDGRNYFKTKEEADEFIFYNKPCLSYNDILLQSRGSDTSKRLDFEGLEEFLKSII